jgi:hypothetical protein
MTAVGRGGGRPLLVVTVLVVLGLLTGCSVSTSWAAERLPASSTTASADASASAEASASAGPSAPTGSSAPASVSTSAPASSDASTSTIPASGGLATSSPTPSFVPPVPRQSFVVVGDSLSAGSNALIGDEQPGVGSWIPAADTAPLSFVGGWAVPGATTAAMLAGAKPMTGSALVLLGGTNDILTGAPATQTLADLTAIAQRVGIAEVLLVAVPPLDSHPAAAIALNKQLAALATQRGWRFLDPWEGIGENGEYVAGSTLDGVHPVGPAADLVGSRIRAELLFGGDR